MNTHQGFKASKLGLLSAVALAMTIALFSGCSQQAAVPPAPADANEILKNSGGTIGPMKGTPGNP